MKSFKNKDYVKKDHKNKKVQNNLKRNNINRDNETQKSYEKKNKDADNISKSYQDIIEGRNAVTELLKSDRDINKIFVQRGEKHGSINQILSLAKNKKVVIVEIEKNKLDQMSETKNHQGIIAIVPPFEYSNVDEILEYAKSKNEEPFIVMLDGIEDVHNLGSIIRTAETAGAHGIIIPKRRSALVNATVSKTSAGAIEYMRVARVNNLNDTIKELKEKGLWIYGTDMEATKYYYEEKLIGPICLIIGSEGFGMSNLVKKNCDVLLKIPMLGKITSLNASVSAGIIMYEIVKQKNIASAT